MIKLINEQFAKGGGDKWRRRRVASDAHAADSAPDPRCEVH
jgi:hypothetical protein